MPVKPCLKWAGGKTQLLPQLLPLFPEKIKTYYEPFIGGGAVFFSLASNKRFESAHINDWNDELVNAYLTVRDAPETLIEKLKLARQEYDKSPEETFYRWRAMDFEHDMDMDVIDRAVRTIALNKTAFNGLFRLNKKGKFNTPWGKYVNPPICDEVNLRACSEALQNTYTSCGDFEHAVEGAGPGDLVYFDPPYLPLTATANFTSYTSAGFTLKDHARLAALFKELISKGATCVLSNHDVPAIRDMFDGFEIHQVDARRSVNSKGGKRGPVKEVIVVGRPHV